MYDSHALSRSRVGPGLPFTADVCKKPCARRTLFAQYFTAAVSVIPNRGSTHKNLGRLTHPANRFGDQLRSVHPAVANALLSRSSPTGRSYVFAGQMNNRIGARKHGNIDSPSLRIPMFRPLQPNDTVPGAE